MAKKVLKKAQDGDAVRKYQREQQAINDAKAQLTPSALKDRLKSIPADKVAKTSLNKRTLSEYEKMYAPKKKMGGAVKKAQDGSLVNAARPLKPGGKSPAAQRFAGQKPAVNSMPKSTVSRYELNQQRIKRQSAQSTDESTLLPKNKMGGMIKRADGSMSKRGLWDNLRANKGSGKKPTAAMLKQEKKIKAQTKKK